jgi:hypothetical protein
MTNSLATTETGFIDRRKSQEGGSPVGVERRQFSNNYGDMQPEVRELAMAIDEYKLRHRRRLVSYEEIYGVIRELGYRKD